MCFFVQLICLRILNRHTKIGKAQFLKEQNEFTGTIHEKVQASALQGKDFKSIV